MTSLIESRTIFIIDIILKIKNRIK